MTLSLREKKLAINRKNILDALLDRMQKQSFESIKISDLCNDAIVSQASFYNYFPKKTDLLVFFIQLWTIESQWLAINHYHANPGVESISAIFKHTATMISKHPNIMGEITAYQATNREQVQWPNLTLADKLISFPDCEGITEFDENGLNTILPLHILAAIRAGELPESTDTGMAMIALTTLFFGVPIVISQSSFDAESLYLSQLELIWNGIRAQFA